MSGDVVTSWVDRNVIPYYKGLIDRDPGATLEQIEAARGKAHWASLLLMAVARLGSREPDTPLLERMVSMGAAIENILLGRRPWDSIQG